MGEPVYYVYGLHDPRDGRLLYIGKGKGRRAWVHEAEERHNRCKNGTKAKALGDLRREGVKPEVRFFAEGLEEFAAYKLERELIARHRGEITNAAGGITSERERVAASAKNTLLDIKPFEVWSAERPREAWEINAYHEIVAGFQRLAELA